MKKFAVFTAIVGNYDTILHPHVIHEDFDYYIFSNDIPEREKGIWNIRPIEYYNPDPVKIARWVKTHPQILLPEYEASLWLDANIQINTHEIYKRCIELYTDTTIKLSSIPHPEHDCIYDELFDMLINHYEHESVILGWGHILRKEKYPRHIGTVESGLLYRRHHDHQVENFNRLWWKSIEEHSRRDQLSFCYAAWKEQLSITPFFTDGTNVRDNSSVNYIQHHNSSGRYINWSGKEAWLCRFAERNTNKIKDIKNLYYWIYGRVFYNEWAFFLGQLFRLSDVLNRKCRHS